jgi:FkbM family methyltransferase
MNAFTIKLRTVARNTGLIRLWNKVRPARAYEEHFHEALQAAVRPGDIVWDVGANVGLYTEIFAGWTGPQGRVVAFEPLAECCAQIAARVREQPWVTAQNKAMGDADTTGWLLTTQDSFSNHIETGTADHGSNDGNTDKQPVVIARGDTVADELQQTPNVVKIDVEGFEEEVLKGMPATLASPALHSVLMEIHFAVLEGRGQATAPLRIEKTLRSYGFSTEWVDASHLVGTRARP